MSATVVAMRRRTSAHEAGHVLMIKHWGGHADRITVSADGERGGVWHSCLGRRSDDPKAELERLFRRLAIKLAGPIATMLDEGRDPRDVEARTLLGVEANFDARLDALAAGVEVLDTFDDFLDAAEPLLSNRLSAYRWMDAALEDARATATRVLSQSTVELEHLTECLLATGEVLSY